MSGSGYRGITFMYHVVSNDPLVQWTGPDIDPNVRLLTEKFLVNVFQIAATNKLNGGNVVGLDRSSQAENIIPFPDSDSGEEMDDSIDTALTSKSQLVKNSPIITEATIKSEPGDIECIPVTQEELHMLQQVLEPAQTADTDLLQNTGSLLTVKEENIDYVPLSSTEDALQPVMEQFQETAIVQTRKSAETPLNYDERLSDSVVKKFKPSCTLSRNKFNRKEDVMRDGEQKRLQIWTTPETKQKVLHAVVQREGQTWHCALCNYESTRKRTLYHVHQHFYKFICACGKMSSSRDFIRKHITKQNGSKAHGGPKQPMFQVDEDSFPDFAVAMNWKRAPKFGKLTPVLGHKSVTLHSSFPAEQPVDKRKNSIPSALTKAESEHEEARGESLIVECGEEVEQTERDREKIDEEELEARRLTIQAMELLEKAEELRK